MRSEPATGLTARFGICGWADPDPVPLAALAAEAPLLPVGPQRAAKTPVDECAASFVLHRLDTAFDVDARPVAPPLCLESP